MKELQIKFILLFTSILILQTSNIDAQCPNADMNIIGASSLCEGDTTWVQNQTLHSSPVLYYVWHWNSDEVVGYPIVTDTNLTYIDPYYYIYDFPDSIIDCSQLGLLFEIELEVVDTCLIPGIPNLNTNSSPVFIYVRPRASFTANTKVCIGNSINFTNTSCPVDMPGITYHWDFGDGFTSSLENPSHTYTSVNTFNPSLTVTNTGGGCNISDTYSIPITILDTPTADFTMSASSLSGNTLCQNKVLTLIDQSSSADSIYYDITPSSGWYLDTTINGIDTQIVFTTPTNYTITQYAYQCGGVVPCGANDILCSNSFSETITVIPAASISLSVPGCVSDLQIDFGNYSNIQGTAPTPVTWTVKDLNTTSIQQTYTGTAPIVNFAQAPFTGYGTYEICVDFPDNCQAIVLCNTFTIADTLIFNPIPDYCLGENVMLDLNSLIVNPSGLTLTWSGTGVINGNTLDVASIPASNTYTVNYSDAISCYSGSLTHTILNGATVSLSSFQPCHTSATIDLDNYVIYGGSQADSIRWNIWEQPNNNLYFTFLGTSPGIISISPGTYIVEVIVYSECGNDTATQNLFVPDILVMDTIPDFCLGDTSVISLDDLVLSPQGLDLTFTGPGVVNDVLTIGNIINPGSVNITYSDVSTCYTGAIDFEIFDNPTVTLSAFPPCHVDSVFNLDLYVTYSGALYDSVLWIVTDISANPPVITTYDTAYPGDIPVYEGTFEVIVNAYGECGIATAVDTIYVPEILNLLPISYQCSNVDTLIDLNDLILNTGLCLTWSGTGITNGQYFNPSQANIGNNTIAYTGCTDICYNGNITINVIDASSTLSPLTVCVSDNGIPLDAIQVGRWSGIGVVSDTFYPSLAGANTFDLVYTSDTGAPCFIQDTLTITVTPSVTATVFVNSPNCVDSTFTFINSSGETVMKWSFTNSTNDLETNTYTVAGTYTEYLIVGNAACRDTLYFDVIVEPYITTTFSIIDTTVECDGITVTLSIDNPHPSYHYLWQVDGNTDTSAYPTFFVQGATIDIFKNIDLTISNTCETIQLLDSVFVPAVFNASFGALQTDTICHGDSISFANISTGYIESFTVNYDNGTTSANNFITQAYFNLDDTIKHYQIMLVIFSNQCQYDTAYQDIYVIPSQIKAAMSISDFGGCEPHLVSFICYSTPGTNSTIYMGDLNNSRITGIQPEDTVFFTYLQAGVYYPYMIAYGCGIDTFYLNPVTVDARPELGMNIPTNACQGENVLLKDTSGNMVGNIAWYIDGALVSDAGGDFTYTFETAGVHQITMTGTHIFTGCKDTITQNITIEAVPDGFDGLIVSPVIGCLDDDEKLLVSVNMTQPYDSIFINFDNNQSSTHPDSAYYIEVGDYNMKIRLITAAGCVIDTAVEITVLPNLEVNAYPTDTLINLGEEVEVFYQSNNNGAHTWYYQTTIADSLLNEAQRFWTIPQSPTQINRYLVQFVGDYPTCIASDTAIVRTTRQGIIDFPEAFSPNNDDLNDKANVLTNGEIEEVLELIISTKQGTHIFHEKNFPPTIQANASSPFDGWDGTSEGQIMPVGVYVWKARVRFIDGTIGYAIGNLSLVR